MGVYGTLQYKISKFSSAFNTAGIKATNICELLRICILIQLISSETTWTENKYVGFF